MINPSNLRRAFEFTSFFTVAYLLTKNGGGNNGAPPAPEFMITQPLMGKKEVPPAVLQMPLSVQQLKDYLQSQEDPDTKQISSNLLF